MKAEPRIRFAGQITGCEGYVESAAIGLLSGKFAAAERTGHELAMPPSTTAMGALLAHITGGHISAEQEGARSYQPMNVNFGLFPPIDQKFRGAERSASKKRAITARAKIDLEAWLDENKADAAA